MRAALVFAALTIPSTNARADGPTPTGPTPTSPAGAPSFRLDLLAEDDDSPPWPYAFATGDEGTLIVLHEGWQEATESYVRVRIHDPAKKKDVEVFGPLRQSAAGAGEQSTSDEDKKVIQGALDRALAARRFRPASAVEPEETHGPVTAPVKNVSVTLAGRQLVVTFDAGAKRKTRRVTVAPPKVYKNVCVTGRQPIGIGDLNYDDSAPWIVVDVVLECGSDEYGDVQLGVPVIVDLR